MLRVVACVARLVLVVVVVTLTGRTALAAPAATAVDEREHALRQMAGVLEYIAGDYRGAVSEHGQVLQPTEYAEQVSMANEARALSSRARLADDEPLALEIAKLQRAVSERQAPAKVAALCRGARERILADYRVSLSPKTLPSRAEGERLFRESGCTTCHGIDGRAQTEAAAKLEPHPANFLDSERMAAVSPHRAFHALSVGVPGTAMQSYAHLSETARWNLAFYVVSLAHTDVDLAAGKRAWLSASLGPLTNAELSALTDEELEAQLSRLDQAARRNAIAYLRAEASFTTASKSTPGAIELATARNKLSIGLDSYRRGDSGSAREAFVAAYLEGFEPHEAALAVRDRPLVLQIERSMLGIRQAAAASAPAEQLESLVHDALALLTRAEHGRSSPTAAFVSALTIAVREGLEIALLLAALLGLVRKRGQAELVRYVHGGWLLAVSAGAATWWAASEVISGMHRELAEGIAALLAAVVLLGVTHWLLGQLTAKRFMGFLADRLGKAASRSAALGVLGLSFVAVYREALEVVLFFQALLLDAGDARSRVLLGAATGLVVLCAVMFVLKQLGQRLRPRPFMVLSSGLLAGLTFVLTGKGVRALQEAGVIPISDLVSWPELPWLGIWPTLQGALAQGTVLLILSFSALWPLLSQSGEPLPTAPSR